MVIFIHIDGRINPADILSKHWGNRQVWENLQPLMFWSGETMNTVFHRSEKEGISPEDNNNDEEGKKIKSVHFDLKGRGVSGKPQERTLDCRTSVSCEASPFRSKTESTIVDVGANAKAPPMYVKHTYIHPVCSKDERAIVGLNTRIFPVCAKDERAVVSVNLDDCPISTDVEYSCHYPSAGTVVRVDEIGSDDANALRVTKIQMDDITKDMAATNTYVLVEDTDVLDPLKYPDALDPLENVVEAKDLDTKSFGSPCRLKS
jgi:hypothetical protein